MKQGKGSSSLLLCGLLETKYLGSMDMGHSLLTHAINTTAGKVTHPPVAAGRIGPAISQSRGENGEIWITFLPCHWPTI